MCTYTTKTKTIKKNKAIAFCNAKEPKQKENKTKAFINALTQKHRPNHSHQHHYKKNLPNQPKTNKYQKDYIIIHKTKAKNEITIAKQNQHTTTIHLSTQHEENLHNINRDRPTGLAQQQNKTKQNYLINTQNTHTNKTTKQDNNKQTMKKHHQITNTHLIIQHKENPYNINRARPTGLAQKQNKTT